MTKKPFRLPAPSLAISLALCLGLSAAIAALPAREALAQNPFAVVVRVNDDAVTAYEIQQRRLFLTLLNAPAEVVGAVRDTLVNERLQVQAARRFGVPASAEAIEQGVAEFAARANMGPEQFVAALGQAGVAPETLRDFIAAGVNWRNVVRARFAQAAQVSDADIDRALSLNRVGEETGAATVDYATIPVSAGRGGDAMARARALRDEVDTCDDLYGLRPEGLERQSVPPGQIPADVAAALSRLDANEMSFDVTRNGGAVVLVTMLCGRSADQPEGAREQAGERLFQQRMQAYASALLEELRAEAIISTPGG
jgi:parvulin-like peptidyl-prolyl isomerase